MVIVKIVPLTSLICRVKLEVAMKLVGQGGLQNIDYQFSQSQKGRGKKAKKVRQPETKDENAACGEMERK